MKPRHSYVLIEILPKDDEVTKAGIHLPEQAARYQQPTGIVLAVGSDVELTLVNQKVVLTNNGYRHSLLGKEMVLIHQNEVLAIID